MKKIIVRALALLVVVTLAAGCTLFRSKTSIEKPVNPNAPSAGGDLLEESLTNVNASSGASVSAEIDVTVGELAADGDAEAAAFVEESGDADFVTSDADVFSGFDQSVQSNDF